MFAVSETAMFCALLLIAKGWKITRSYLPPTGMNYLFFIFLINEETHIFYTRNEDNIGCIAILARNPAILLLFQRCIFFPEPSYRIFLHASIDIHFHDEKYESLGNSA